MGCMDNRTESWELADTIEDGMPLEDYLFLLTFIREVLT